MPKRLQGGTLLIPDIHGHWPRFQAALDAAEFIPGVQLVFLGDLIDDAPSRRQARGDQRLPEEPDQSREILKQVRALHAADRAQVVLGNHEIMALGGVLDGDEQLFDIWWRYGGRAAAASYGWKLREAAGPLLDDWQWLREQGRLWTSVGPPGALVLAAHATRPAPERIVSGLNRASDLCPSPREEPVVWFPLRAEAPDPPPLPDGYVASVHGHMQVPDVRYLSGPDGKPALQLDLKAGLNRLAMVHVAEDGERTELIRPVEL